MDSYIKSIIVNLFPTWEESLWDALQKKNWQKFEIEFDDFLSRLEEEEIKNLPWLELIKGQALLRGNNVSLQEWQKYIQPIIAIATINFLDGFKLARIYSKLDLPELVSFHKNLIEIIPAETESLKLEWLKENKPSFYLFLIASPLNGLIEIVSKNDVLFNEFKTYYKNLSPQLKEKITSYDASEFVSELGKEFNLSEEKIKTLAEIYGQTLIGFIKPENLLNEIKNKLVLNDEEAEKLIKKLEQIIKPLLEEINNLRTPMADIIALTKKTSEKTTFGEKTISLEKFKPEKTTQQIEIKIGKIPIPELNPDNASQNKPFILHEEKKLEIDQEKPKTPPKTFSFPFKIFTPKPASEPTMPVKAEIKIDGSDKQPPTEKKKLTIFKKESPQKIIHYSEMRTILEPFTIKSQELENIKPKETKPEEIINLETLQPQTKTFSPLSQKETKPKNNNFLNLETNSDSKLKNDAEKNQPVKTNSQPKLEGNTINLKNDS